MDYYNKRGKKIDLDQWLELFEDRDYQVIAQQRTPGHRFFISTVWLGIDHGIGISPKPLIYETMVWGKRDDLLQRRYSSLTDARRGHKKLYAKYAKQDIILIQDVIKKIKTS